MPPSRLGSPSRWRRRAGDAARALAAGALVAGLSSPAVALAVSCAAGVENGSPCDDGLACNGTDVCAGGECSVHLYDVCPRDAICMESPFDCRPCLPGDCNRNGALDAGDPVCEVLCVVGSPPAGADCERAGNCNCVAGVEAADPICSVLRLTGSFSDAGCLAGACAAAPAGSSPPPMRCPSAVGTAPAAANTTVHPYLLFGPDDLDAIRARSASGPAAEYRRYLEESCDSEYDNWLPGQYDSAEGGRKPTYEDRIAMLYAARFAFYGMLEGRSQFTERAKDLLLAASEWTHMGAAEERPFTMAQGELMRSAALTYDLVYSELSTSERAKAEAFLAMGAEFLYEADGYNNWWARSDERVGNWRAAMYSGVGMVGLALYGVHPDASTWVAEATRMLKAILDQDYDREGGSYESFTRYTLSVQHHAIIPVMDALRRVTGEDLFRYNGCVLYHAIPFTAYMLLPDRTGAFALGDNDADDNYSFGLHLLKAAAEYDDALAAWYLEDLLDGNYFGDNEGIWGTLWAVSIPTENPDRSDRLELAKAYNSNIDDPYAFGTGHVFLRTGFSDEYAVWMALQAGDAGGFHGHADKGSFVLSAYGSDFLVDAFSNSGGGEYEFYKSGRGHQTVVIEDEGTCPSVGLCDPDDLCNLEGKCTPEAQCEDRARCNARDRCLGGNPEGQGADEIGVCDAEYWIEVARVPRLERRPGYDHVWIDTGDVYRQNPVNEDVTHAERQIVFVRTDADSGYFVVIDDLAKDDLGTYRHPYHYPPSVAVQSLSGDRVVLDGSEADLHIVVAHPTSGVSATDRSDYTTDYVEFTLGPPTNRLVAMTVLYPVRDGDSVPAIDSFDVGDHAVVTVGETVFRYDRLSHELFVD